MLHLDQLVRGIERTLAGYEDLRECRLGGDQVHTTSLIAVASETEDASLVGWVESIFQITGHGRLNKWEGGLYILVEGRIVRDVGASKDKTFVGIVAYHDFEIFVEGTLQEEFAGNGWGDQSIHRGPIGELAVGRISDLNNVGHLEGAVWQLPRFFNGAHICQVEKGVEGLLLLVIAG